METLLRAVNLTKRFGGLVAVNEVSLEINLGEVVGLVGDNGAGKSTLIKGIAGIYPYNEGEIYFEGHRGQPAIWASRPSTRTWLWLRIWMSAPTSFWDAK